jgi:hypothetical protein
MSTTWVVSDVHGHLADLRHTLEHAGLVAQDRWVADDATLWVLGDLVDRGPDGIGVVHYLRSLQQQAPEQVHVLMGNHEALMLGQRLFPQRFRDVWQLNGGHRDDQAGLTDDDVAWLRSLPAMALAGDRLLMHADTTGYLSWGESVEEINARVTRMATGHDEQQHFDLFAALTERFEFAGDDGTAVATTMLERLGGSQIVHGHTIIGLLLGRPSSQTTEPLLYADGLVVAVDGGRYDGGPLLLVRLS